MSGSAARESWAIARNGLATLLGVTIVALLLVAPSAAGPERAAAPPAGWAPDLPTPEGVGPSARAPLKLLRGEGLDFATASRRDLELIDGIGPERARRLVAARRAGTLGSFADIDRLPGFGPTLLGKLGASLVIGESRDERDDG
ncbi:MAG: hypothetical protein U0610_26365 [bacterium]